MRVRPRLVYFPKWRRSAALHQWSPLQTGEYSDPAALRFQLGTLFSTFFYFLDGAAGLSNVRLCGLEAALLSLESFISQSSHSNLSQDFSTCLS